MKVEVRAVDPGPLRIAEVETVVKGITAKTIEKLSPVPANGEYFETFVSPDAGPLVPEVVEAGVLDGSIEITTPIEEANAIVHKLSHDARLSIGERARYQRVLRAWAYVSAEAMRSEALSVLGYEEGDDLTSTNAHAFMTTAEVARIFRVDESTVRAWSGNRLPAAIRVGRKWLFRSDAILSVVRNAGPKKPAPVVEPSPAPSTTIPKNYDAKLSKDELRTMFR